MSKKRLYLFVTLAAASGLLWILLNMLAPKAMSSVPACPFRAVSGIPCPSCGITHSVIKIFEMDWSAAFYYNPLGFLMAIAVIVIPAWIMYDVIQKKNSFYSFYNLSETALRKYWLAVPLAMLITINWVWNIYKYTQ